MRALGSYRLSLVVVLAGAFGMIGGDFSSVGGETQTVKRLPAAVAAVDGSAFARTTYEQMTAFDRANPDQPQRTIPRMPTPPPRALGENGVAVAEGDPQPVEREPALQIPENVVPGTEPAPSTAAPPLTGNFAGTIDNSTLIPPDTNGAVGPNHVAEFLNTGFQVFSRTGTVILPQITAQAFWSALGTAPGQPASRLTDPRIAFDQYADRWVAVIDGNPQRSDGTNNAWILAGISDSNDPTGTWNLYAIRANIAVTHPNDWADFTSLGLDPNNVVVTSRIFTQAGAVVHADAWVVNKATMIAGPGPLVQGVDYTVFHNPCGLGGFQFSPCHTFGQTPGTGVNYLVNDGWLDNTTRTRRFMAVYAINGTGAAATLACGTGGNLFVELAQYNFNLLSSPQLSCSTPIDNGSNSIQNAVWRNGRIWTTHAVGAGSGTDSAPPSKGEIAWYQINPAAAGPFPGGVPEQQGRVVHATQHYSYPSIAVNGDECVALGFSGSDSATFASGYYTLRLPTDPPGTMQAVALLKAGVAPYRKQYGGSRNRWGDYSATCVDPVNDLTFWTVQEYAETQFPPGGATCGVDLGKWGTWWGAFYSGEIIKFSQPPDNVGEDAESDIDWTDMIPNVVVADDFVSDGRPITTVRWWGSNLAALMGSAAGLPGVRQNTVPALRPAQTLPSAQSNVAVVGGDTCATAGVIAGLPFSDTGNTCAFADNYNEVCPYTPTGAPDVAYVFTPSTNMVVDISLCANSAYDTKLYVYQGSCPGAVVACNDDSCSTPSLPDPWVSEVLGISLTSGVTYYVIVDGYDSTTCGNYTLDIAAIVCGDSIIGSGEECDPPNGITCNGSCQSIICGDGVVDGLEQCDPPNGLTCDAQCQTIFNPPIDGWLVSFHEPLTVGGAPSPPLALYFCDATIVTVAPTALGACDAHPVRKYDVDLADCCLVRSYPDSRNGLTPGQPGVFLETQCFNYDIDIQAVVGSKWVDSGGTCVEVVTGNTATAPFWGWHTTSVESGLRPALQSVVSMSGPDLLYGPWANVTPTCSQPNMAFELITDVNGTNEDCQPNGIPDYCDIRDCPPNDLACRDCQPDGIPDSCQLAGNDANGNGIPDECDPPGNIEWGPATSGPTGANCAGPSGPWPNCNPDATTRSLRFKVTSAAIGTPLQDAIKVTMVDLQHPIPANLAAQAPPNFTTYDTRLNGVCNGGTLVGHHCDADADCPPLPVVVGRCSSMVTCTAAGETNGCARWVGKPGTFLENQDAPGGATYKAARLQCTPFYYDWVAETMSGPIAVVGAEITPSSEYSVQTYGVSCLGTESTCTAVSTAVTMYTRRSGDAAPNFNPPSTTGQPDALDVAAVVTKLKNLPGALVKAITQLQPNLPELNANVNALDIVAVVDGVRGVKYGFSGPCVCPSTVTCGGSCTGCTGMCVKTCTGGTNAGDPCIDSTRHCPGGTCGTPLCRDRCGRCKP